MSTSIENREIHCYYSNLKSIKIREYKNTQGKLFQATTSYKTSYN